MSHWLRTEPAEIYFLMTFYLTSSWAKAATQTDEIIMKFPQVDFEIEAVIHCAPISTAYAVIM